MALVDGTYELCDATAITVTSGATAVLGTGAAINTVRDIGHGTPLYVRVTLNSALSSASASSLQLQLVTADNSALTTNVTILQLSPAYATSSTAIPAGRLLWETTLPSAGPNKYRAFVGLRQTNGGNTLDAATVNAMITTHQIKTDTLPDAVN